MARKATKPARKQKTERFEMLLTVEHRKRFQKAADELAMSLAQWLTIAGLEKIWHDNREE